MDSKQVIEHRSKVITKLREAIQLNGEATTPERTEGTLQALCAVAGTLFAAKHRLGVDVVKTGMIGGAAMHGMEEWFEEYNAGRN